VEPAVSQLLATEQGPRIHTIESFEGFLEEVVRHVQESGQLLLFVGEHLRLEITLLRHPKNPRVIWGLKAHEDWAFKATLLRFARDTQAVHVILLCRTNEQDEDHGWLAKRSSDGFWASALPSEQTDQFLHRCHA
jgi:hypothetical protein